MTHVNEEVAMTIQFYAADDSITLAEVARRVRADIPGCKVYYKHVQAVLDTQTAPAAAPVAQTAPIVAHDYAAEVKALYGDIVLATANTELDPMWAILGFDGDSVHLGDARKAITVSRKSGRVLSTVARHARSK